jgi:hypothetical protein
MRIVAEYREHAKQCRDLAARASIPADKKRLKYEAEAWAKMAAQRERNLTDKINPPTKSVCK